MSAVRIRLALRLGALLVVGVGVAATALVTGQRGIILVGGTGAALVLGAVATGWRWAGSASVAVLAAVAAVAGAALPGPGGTWLLVAAAAATLAYIVGLDHVERPRRSTPVVSLTRGSLAARVVTPALGLAGAGLVGVVAAQPVVPSVPLVVLGLVAGAGAVLVATRSR
ncbi:MAG: hypothetical protein QOH80_1421 [Actinomycetota bacterium]|jgi:hypothetical protein|nr:hypothetical protein [Actinomycetota bacterium]